MSHHNLFDQGKPIPVSGLALQAELQSSTAACSKAWCGVVTATAEPGSRPRPALVRVAFDVHFGYHIRSHFSDSGEVSRSSAFSSPDCTAAKDVAVDTSEILFLSPKVAAICCAADW